ncbi:MAG: hypothetical protein ACOYB0_08290 [Polynucleobacter sp.]
MNSPIYLPTINSPEGLALYGSDPGAVKAQLAADLHPDKRAALPLFAELLDRVQGAPTQGYVSMTALAKRENGHIVAVQITPGDRPFVIWNFTAGE